MYFWWLLVLVIMEYESDNDFSLAGLTQESCEIQIENVSDEENDERSNFSLLLDSARELASGGTTEVAHFDNHLHDIGFSSQISYQSQSDGNASKRMRYSELADHNDIEVIFDVSYHLIVPLICCAKVCLKLS